MSERQCWNTPLGSFSRKNSTFYKKKKESLWLPLNILTALEEGGGKFETKNGIPPRNNNNNNNNKYVCIYIYNINKYYIIKINNKNKKKNKIWHSLWDSIYSKKKKNFFLQFF